MNFPSNRYTMYKQLCSKSLFLLCWINFAEARRFDQTALSVYSSEA